MKFWRPKYNVCKECGVHFDPPRLGSYEAQWSDLCPTHRGIAIEKHQKRSKLIAWVDKNSERLTKMMEEEEREALQKSVNQQLNNPYTGYVGLQSQSNTFGLAGVGSWLWGGYN